MNKVLVVLVALALSILCCAAQWQVGDRILFSSSGGITVSDDFHSAWCGYLGPNWVNPVPTGSQPVYGDMFGGCIDFKGYTGNAAVGNAVAYWGTDSFASYPDQYSQATVNDLVMAGTAAWVGVSVRVQPTGAMYVCLVYNSGGATSSSIYVRDASDTWTLLASGTSVSPGDVIRLEVVGSSLTCKLNGTTMAGPVTDTTLTSGQPGIAASGNGYGGAARAGNWSAGSISSGPPPVTLPTAAALFPLNNNTPPNPADSNHATFTDTSGNSVTGIYLNYNTGGFCPGGYWHTDSTYGIVGCFDGGNQYVWIDQTAASLAAIQNDVTISAKINFSVTSGYQWIASLGSDFSGTSGTGWAGLIQIEPDGHADFAIVTGGAAYTVASTSVVSSSAWHTITGVRSGGTIKIYVDGVLSNTNSAPTGDLRSYGSTANPHLLGVYQGGGTGSNWFKGYMRDVRYYNVALTDAQVAYLATL